jgi:hypothetical protein
VFVGLLDFVDLATNSRQIGSEAACAVHEGSRAARANGLWDMEFS